MGIERAEVVARMRRAIKRGVSGHRFISDMKAKGLSYRRTDMLGDWRSAKNVAKVEGALRYVRKGSYPTQKIIATTTYRLSKEFMYVVKIKNRLKPDEPVLEHNINIQTDVPLTPAMIERRVIEERAKEEKYFGEILLETRPWTVIRRVD